MSLQSPTCYNLPVKVGELGEFKLIEIVHGLLEKARVDTTVWRNLVIGVGDDAAAWQSDGSVELATVDSLVQGVHFQLGQLSWSDLGWKALAISLSDIAAMGGIPTYALVSLALPPEVEVAQVTALYRGLLKLAGEFGVAIIGGDTDSTPHIRVTTTVLGTMGASKGLLCRGAARPGDQIAVTGYLGSAAAGLAMLSRKMKLDRESAAYLKQVFRRPEPRVKEGHLLLKYGVHTAIDVSDGLVSDLGHICQVSRVGARIRASKLPIAPVVKANFGQEATAFALSGGEDYELLFTATSAVMNKVLQAADFPVTVIGDITVDNPGAVQILDSYGQPVQVKQKGWEHFVSV